MAWHHDISFMRSPGTAVFFFAVDGGAEEMCSRVHTRGVDVVVFGIFAHFDGGWIVERLEGMLVAGRVTYK